MTRRDEAIRMARSTGWDFGWEMTVEQVCEFADMVAAAKQGQCAKACIALAATTNADGVMALRFAAAIRALKDEVSE